MTNQSHKHNFSISVGVLIKGEYGSFFFQPVVATVQDKKMREAQDVLYINVTTCLCCVGRHAPFNASSFHWHICPMKPKTNFMVNQWEHEILSSVRVKDKLSAHLFVMVHKETKHEILFVVLPKLVQEQPYCYILG